MKRSRNNIAVDTIDMELCEIDALAQNLRLLWENLSWEGLEEAREIGVTVSFVIADKIARARHCVPAAYVLRVQAGRG